MHATLAGAIYRNAARLRNPSLWAEYERLKASETLDLRALEQLQLERASVLLNFAARHSAFYRERFRAAAFDPARFSSLSDLTKLPVVTKGTLIDHNAAIHSDFPFPRLLTAETSGTSGQALEFRRNERWDSINRAHVMRAYDWYGVRTWERNGYLWGYDIDQKRAPRVRLLDALQNRFRLFRYDKESVVQFARELAEAQYLGGYSSMIFEVAKAMNEHGLTSPELRLVKGTSEMILDVYQPEALKAFGRRIVSEYGAAEAGLIAFECPSGRMHINVEDVIVETDADGGIIVTNLASLSFPIIRYQLGDVVKLSNDSCVCGRAHPIISEVVGRRGGTVIGAVGKYPALTFYYVFKNIALRHGVLLNYRVVQKAPGECDLQIEGAPSAKNDTLIDQELKKYFAADVQFHIEYVASFPRGGRKAQSFQSLL